MFLIESHSVMIIHNTYNIRYNGEYITYSIDPGRCWVVDKLQGLNALDPRRASRDETSLRFQSVSFRS